MELLQQKRLLDLLWRSIVKKETSPEQVPFYPQKCLSSFHLPLEKEAFLHVAPESVGIGSDYVETFLHRLEEATNENIHSVLLLCDGKCILEASAKAYSTRRFHLTYSMCKTITGLAIGMLVDDGLLALDTLVFTLFREFLPKFKLPNAKYKDITIRHLLTMQSGVNFAEIGSVIEEDWVRAFFSSGFRTNPGTAFHYNSMNSFMLSAVVQKITGQRLDEFLKERLWKPLDIENVFWEKSGSGIAKGGWGLYLSAQSMAKIGQLFLDDGVYNGKRVISSHWLKEATATHAIANKNKEYNYGYHLWTSETDSTYLFNGMLGQNVWVCPKNRIVAVFTAGSSVVFQNLRMLGLTKEMFGVNFTRGKPSKPPFGAVGKLDKAQKNFWQKNLWITPQTPTFFRRKITVPKQINRYLGIWNVAKNNQSVLPLFNRMLQNNHSAGISSLHFKIEEDKLFLNVVEGASLYTLPIGFGDYHTTELNIKKEKYMVAVLGGFAFNEDGEEILKIELKYPEMPNTRRLKFSIADGRGMLYMQEMPGLDVILGLVGATASSLNSSSRLMNFALNSFYVDYCKMKVVEAFSPALPIAREITALPPPSDTTHETDLFKDYTEVEIETKTERENDVNALPEIEAP